MNVDKIAAQRYAEAIFNIAKERNELESLEADASGVEAVLATKQGDRFQTFIESPVGLTKDKVALTEKLYEGKVSTLLLNLIIMLVKRGRVGNLPLILELLHDRISEEKGIVPGIVTTAYELDDAAKEKMTKALSKKLGKDLQLRFTVKPAILGGVIVKVQDTLLDDSLQTKMKEITSRLMKIDLRNATAA